MRRVRGTGSRVPDTGHGSTPPELDVAVELARRSGNVTGERWRWSVAGVWLAVLAVVGACNWQPSSPPAQATPPIASVPRDSASDRSATAPPASASRGGATAGAGDWDVDLDRDERRGGHTLARHVGRTDAQLRARLARESVSGASTYGDRHTAERIVERALAENARRVQRWIDQRAPKTNLAIRHRARDGLPTGRLMRRGGDVAEEVQGAVVVLRWRDDDWYVLTSYPEDVR